MLKISLKTETCVWGLNIFGASVGFPGTQSCKIAQVIMLVKSWPYPDFLFQKYDLNTQQIIIKNLLWCVFKINYSDEIQFKQINK